MATTTVRISIDAKRRLDRLQAQALLALGESLSKEEILERLVAYAEERPIDVLGGWRPPSEESIQRMMSLGFSTGKRTREEDIDRDIYGA